MFAIGDWKDWLSRRWDEAVWQARPEEGAVSQRFRAHLRAAEAAVLSFGADRITLRANALTYRTLLSLAPFLAVAFSVFKAFGGLHAAEEALQRRVLQNLAPGAAAAVMEHVDAFLGRISEGAVGGLGVLVLFFTVVSLLTAIEQSFNALWQVDKVRPFLDRFVTYWAMITVGPILMALSFTLTSAARSSTLVGSVVSRVPGAGGVVFATMPLVPWLITCAAVTSLYLIVPNARVKWRCALGGGLMAGTLWEFGKVVFTWASAHLFRYDAIYGSFAALVVLLLWLQIGWVIVLFGCKVAYALQHERALVAGRAGGMLSPAEREALAVRCLLEAARAFLSGTRGPTAEELAAGTAVLDIRKQVLNPLVARGLLVMVAEERTPGEEREERYLPGRDPEAITLKEPIDAIRCAGAGGLEIEEAAGSAGGRHAADRDSVELFASELARRVDEALASATAGLTVAEAVRRIAPRPAETPGRASAARDARDGNGSP
ncbi:MAG TPA: YhjD/YihY/BrkB family envelope integrity protein [Vicinamibacteria bacterium]|nr:YhjD/YihY/BrkB family envelope integrity protein [Vicinamibacteria bacterium]